MKRILFVVDERKLGGVSIVLENILKNIKIKNLDITVLVLHNNGDRLNDLPEGIKVIYGNSYFNTVDIDFSSLIKTGRIFKAIKKVYISLLMKSGKIEKYIKKARNKMGLDKFDLEISFKSGFCSLFVAYGNSSKKINWVHEDYKTYNKTKKYEKTFKKAFNEFDRQVIVSDEAAESFNGIYGMEDKTVVIENYIDIDDIIEKSNQTSKVKADKNKINVVTLGRFCHEKGFDRLIDAVQILVKENVNNVEKFKIYILGYGADEEMLNNKISEYSLNDFVEIINVNKIENNPYAFMKQCDLYVMPSRSESFGMVRIEALTLGLPVITTNTANTNKMINNKIGIVVENSVNGIVFGLKQVLENEEILNDMKHVVKLYSYAEENKRIINKIEILLEESFE